MKRIVKIIHCLNNKIKKNFFNGKIESKSTECKQLFSLNEKEQSGEEQLKENEYFDNYKITTRWQTV